MRILITFISLLAFSAVAQAKVDLKSTKRLIVPVDNVTPRITQKDVAKVVPLDLKQGDSQSTVITRIADRGFGLWFNSIKDTSIGRLAETAQERLKTDIEITPSEDEGTRHKFSFKVEAFQAMAKVEYTGWMNAEINFDAKSAQTDIQLKDKVFDNKDLIVSHKSTKEQALSMIGLAWSW